MPITIKNPINKVAMRWREIMSAEIGEGNVSIEPTSSISNDKTRFARISMLGNPTGATDLEGDECSQTITFQCEVYASGLKSLSAVYDLDEISHKAMVGMGFTRTYTRPTINADESLKRIVSRYRIRNYTGYLIGD